MDLKGRSAILFAVVVGFFCLSSVAVALRCFVRLRLVKAFGRDDALMVCAMALNVWFAACSITSLIYGGGRRLRDIGTLADVRRALFWWWLSQAAYVWTVAVTRVSIALSILRFTMRALQSAIIYTIIGTTILVGAAFWLVLMLQCEPISEFWQRTGNGRCINKNYVVDIAYFYSAVSCTCDFTLVVIAGYVVKDLRRRWWVKWGLAGILGMGCIASAAVVVRFPFLQGYKDADFLYTTTQLSMLSYVEVNLGITAGSLNTVRPLVRWARDIIHGGLHNNARLGSGGIGV